MERQVGVPGQHYRQPISAMLCPVLSWHTRHALHAHALLNSSGKAFSETQWTYQPHGTPDQLPEAVWHVQRAKCHSTGRGSMLHHKEVHQATCDDIGESHTCDDDCCFQSMQLHLTSNMMGVLSSIWQVSGAIAEGCCARPLKLTSMFQPNLWSLSSCWYALQLLALDCTIVIGQPLDQCSLRDKPHTTRLLSLTTHALPHATHFLPFAARFPPGFCPLLPAPAIATCNLLHASSSCKCSLLATPCLAPPLRNYPIKLFNQVERVL